MIFLVLLLASDADALLARVAAAGKDMQGLAGDFTQKKRIAAFKQELTSHGRFVFARPAHLEWRYTDPDPSALVVDGDKATLTLPDEPPRSYDLAKQPGLRAVIRQMQLWLGGGDPAQIKNDYELSLQKGTLHLVPRDAKLRSRIASVDVEFDDKTMLPRAVRVGEAGGDQTAISFSNLKKK
jgi:outer membrane lipoprotein-sorting protein